jgi:hypothetical protein
MHVLFENTVNLTPMKVLRSNRSLKKIGQDEDTCIRIRDIVFEKTANSTVHGLPRVARSDTCCLKIMWLIFFLTSFSISIFFVIQCINAYLKYEVVTKITQVHKSPAEFPTVSICSINQFSTNFSREFATKILAKNKMLNAYQLDNNLIKTMVSRYFVGMNARDPAVSDEERKRLSMPLEDMLISCTFGAKPCTTYDFEW